MIRIHASARALVIVALAAVTGCQLPDIEAFHANTVALDQAIKTAGNSTSERIRSFELADADGNAIPVDDARHPATGFDKEWQTRIDSMNALTEYSRALANIVAAANNAQANVKATMDAAGELAGQFGFSAVSQEVSSLIVQIGAELIKVKAAKDLEEAVDNLDPLITKIATIYAADLQDLEDYTRNWLSRHGRTLLRDEHRAWIDDYDLLLERQDFLLVQRGQIQLARLSLGTRAQAIDEFLDTIEQDRAFHAKSLVENTRAVGADQSDRADEFLRLISDELKNLDPWLEAKAEDYATYQADLAELNEANLRQALFLETSREAVAAWAKAHHDLRFAIKNNTTFNAEALAQIVVQVRALADKEAP